MLRSALHERSVSHIQRPPHYLSLSLLNDAPKPKTSTLSLHDALPIYPALGAYGLRLAQAGHAVLAAPWWFEQVSAADRSEEHTSELQSRGHLVCRLLLEKKKTTRVTHYATRRDIQRIQFR